MVKCCKLYSLICDPDGKIWIFEFFLGVCSTELRSLVSSLGNLVSNGRQILLGGIRLGSSATVEGKRQSGARSATLRQSSWGRRGAQEVELRSSGYQEVQEMAEQERRGNR